MLRVNSPYWKDEVTKDIWVYLTPEVNKIVGVKIRDIAVEKGLVDDPLSVALDLGLDDVEASRGGYFLLGGVALAGTAAIASRPVAMQSV